MKRMSYFVMALALVLGLAQCKKEQPEPQTQSVRITLNVENGDSKHEVVPGTGAVNFQDGDVIYVGDGSTYIGTLTRSGETFSGEINEPTGSSPKLHFFFIGGVYRLIGKRHNPINYCGHQRPIHHTSCIVIQFSGLYRFRFLFLQA